MDCTSLKPRLKSSISINGQGITINRSGVEFYVTELPLEPEIAQKVLESFDGEKSVSQVVQNVNGASIETVSALIESFNEAGFITKDSCDDTVLSGLDCLLVLEDLQNKLMYETLYKNEFWLRCQNPESVPRNVFYGMAIENYHFLFRESWFDSPILSFATSIESRVLMNEFFCEEYGHDELILKSLNNIGITREQIYKTVPLPETLALCNALAHWSASDPLFFFSTMGVLEGKDLKIDSYVTAMEESSLVQDEFIRHIRDHSNINLNDEHGNLSREIFRRIPVISKEDLERMKKQTHLFIEIYDRFYTAIWDHYSKTESLLRLVD